jgi:hypothetical protein
VQRLSSPPHCAPHLGPLLAKPPHSATPRPPPASPRPSRWCSFPGVPRLQAPASPSAGAVLRATGPKTAPEATGCLHPHSPPGTTVDRSPATPNRPAATSSSIAQASRSSTTGPSPPYAAPPACRHQASLAAHPPPWSTFSGEHHNPNAPQIVPPRCRDALAAGPHRPRRRRSCAMVPLFFFRGWVTSLG